MVRPMCSASKEKKKIPSDFKRLLLSSDPANYRPPLTRDQTALYVKSDL